MVVEEPEMAEGIAGGEGEGEDVYSGATEVLSEGGTEVIKSGEVKSVAKGLNEEEEVVQQVGNMEEKIEQAVGNREEVILVTDDGGVNDEEQPKEVADQTSGGHRDSSVGKLTETAATSGRMARKGVDSEDEEEEEENTLIRRPRSSRRPLTEETAAQDERQTEETAAQEERQEEVPTGETEAEDERLRRERKRKGKQLARPVKKKVKQASGNVVIQEPAQAPHGMTRYEVEAWEEASDEEELR